MLAILQIGLPTEVIVDGHFQVLDTVLLGGAVYLDVDLL